MISPSPNTLSSRGRSREILITTRRHTDSFYVIEGELEFHLDGWSVRATAGALLVAPPRAVHAFPVAIGARARFLHLHTPGLNWESYLRELTALRLRGEKPGADFLRSHDIYDV